MKKNDVTSTPAEEGDNISQREIAENVQSIKNRRALGVDIYSPYPYDKEKLLIYAIKSGNEADAKRYLNEILGYIFFASADIDEVKLRSYELTVLISRAALDGGADEAAIYRNSPKYIARFLSLDSIDDVCEKLTEMLRDFTLETFKTGESKHAAIITGVVSYIRNNYMHRITLDGTAAHVYLSPSYLSKIFKDEMQTTFNAYLNSVRIEKSKTILLSNTLSISEVSDLVGFADQSYFNKVFKKYVGVTPKKYRDMRGIQND